MQSGGTGVAATVSEGGAAEGRWPRGLKAWLPLLLLQGLVAALVLFPFISGSLYFAFVDIASDTYVASAGHMHLARMLAGEGIAAWSFGIGLGAPTTFMFGDPFGLLTALRGPEHVLELRIWVYLLKIALGGGFFFLLARALAQRKESALLAALAYSFCGYIVTNGVWDSETNIFVFAPLVAWGIQRYLRSGDWLTFPLAVAAMLLSGVFFVLVGVSLLVACGVCVAAAPSRRAMLQAWLTRLFPLAAIGFLLAAPNVVPVALQLLDSPRVGGAGSILDRLARQGLAVSDGFGLLTQIGGLFHKDIFGIGGFHASYMNYLESPGFYVGMLPLLVLPQLWRSDSGERRVLVVGLVAVALYIVFPFFRMAAFGFSAPYFRGTTMWITLGLLLLGLRAIDRVLTHGIDGRLLLVGAASLWTLLAILGWFAPVSPTHAVRMALIVAVWSAVLALPIVCRIRPEKLLSLMLALLMMELVTTAWPSYFVMRTHVSPELQPYNDATLPALAAIRADRPPAFYRVEKTFDSSSLSEALAQDYRGVKSYYYHGRSVVQFYEGMDLMPQSEHRAVNYTNWLPSPGDRFILQSVLGVRYIISKARLDWPGLAQIASGDGYVVYRNDLALPLGVVHTRQVTTAQMEKLSGVPLENARWLKDVALMNAVVLDEPMPQWGQPFDLAALAEKGEIDAPQHYAGPALAHQRTGLQVSHFSDDRITGTITPGQPGILVFSIPAYRGWSLRIDGQPVALMTADFGLLAAPVTAGRHDVELSYRRPGWLPGLGLGALGVLVLGLLLVRRRMAAAQGRTKP